MSTKLLYSCFVIFFDLYKEYSSCLISFLGFSELFPAFSCAKEIGNLLSIWLSVSIVNPCPLCFRSFKQKSRILLTIFSIFFPSFFSTPSGLKMRFDCNYQLFLNCVKFVVFYQTCHKQKLLQINLSIFFLIFSDLT